MATYRVIIPTKKKAFPYYFMCQKCGLGNHVMEYVSTSSSAQGNLPERYKERILC